MINKSLSLLAALAGVALTGTAFAYSPTDSAKPAGISAPRVVASSVVTPIRVPAEFMGATVDVTFTLDQSGRPHEIRVLWVDDPILQKRLVAAFSQWRFEQPGASNPAAAPKRYILPIQINPEV